MKHYPVSLPDSVVGRAREILYGLEAGNHTVGQPQLVRPKPRKPKDDDKEQLQLFGL